MVIVKKHYQASAHSVGTMAALKTGVANQKIVPLKTAGKLPQFVWCR
jgi:hypothetical protein